MRIAAIVPTWREASHITTLVSACALAVDEVIVVDADSPDGTAELARRAGARVVYARRGRGFQLNIGARATSADVLWFIHADTVLPSGVRSCIQQALRDPQVVGGNFRLRFVPETRAARVFAHVNHLRRRYLNIYYGDSCIFVRRSVFETLGGFPEQELFEDYEFARRLSTCGKTHYETRLAIETSSRRFANRPVQTVMIWALLQGLYSAGVSAGLLSRWYRAVR